MKAGPICRFYVISAGWKVVKVNGGVSPHHNLPLHKHSTSTLPQPADPALSHSRTWKLSPTSSQEIHKMVVKVSLESRCTTCPRLALLGLPSCCPSRDSFARENRQGLTIHRSESTASVVSVALSSVTRKSNLEVCCKSSADSLLSVEHGDVDIVAVNDPFIEPHYAVCAPQSQHSGERT